MKEIISKPLALDEDMFNIPKCAQDAIPVLNIFGDGIFQIGKERFSKSYKFMDINYNFASEDEQVIMFRKYSEILNSFDSELETQITICNHRINEEAFKNRLLIPYIDDGLNEYRDEMNNILLEKASVSNLLLQEKYLTITINRKNIDDARNYFSIIETAIKTKFKALGSDISPLSIEERIKIFYDFFEPGEESEYSFNFKECERKGEDFKKYILPKSLEFMKDKFKIGDKYGRVLFLKNYPTGLKDIMIGEITALNRNLMLSIDIQPYSKEKGIRMTEKIQLGIETDITNWQMRQNSNNNFSATVPYSMDLKRQHLNGVLKDLNERNQSLFCTCTTIVVTANSEKELDKDTNAIASVVKGRFCEPAVLNFQQLDGLNTVLPYGSRKIFSNRTLTTESLTTLMPFRVQDMCHKNGLYYGQNTISNNLIMVDRSELVNGNSIILGVSGGGKSFIAKVEIILRMLKGDSDIIIIDPEREYGDLVTALGGEVINISSSSKTHINAMDFNADYDKSEADAIALKSDFLMSICEQIDKDRELGPDEKSIIDRCVKKVYSDYQQNGYKGDAPTLRDFRRVLSNQKEPIAKELALKLELYTEGTLNCFAHQTNVDTTNRLLCYDILDLGESLRSFGMLVVLDSILNRISQNRVKGKKTFIFIDEIYLFFEHEYSANFLFTLWKRVRKYGAYATGITQNIEDLLQSYTARTMLANSEFVILLKQGSTDRSTLAGLLNISPSQMDSVTNVEAGQGLIKVKNSLMPFVNQFPENTKLYKLITTKFEDNFEKGGA